MSSAVTAYHRPTKATHTDDIGLCGNTYAVPTYNVPVPAETRYQLSYYINSTLSRESREDHEGQTYRPYLNEFEGEDEG